MLKRLFLILTCLSLATAVTACGDDSEGGDSTANNGDTNNGDTNNGDTNNGDTNNGDTNNGDTNNGDTNNGDTNNGDANNGANNGGDIEPEEAGTPADYAYYSNGNAARLSALVLLEDPVDGFDLNGDGDPDNALGSLLGTIGGLVGDGADIQGTVDAALADGSINVGAVFTDGIDVSSTRLHMFVLEDNGDGTYGAEPLSFAPGTKTPQVRFNASIDGGAMTTSAADFILNIPIAGLDLTLVVSDARIVGNVGTDGTGVTLSNGYLVGAVSVQSLVDALNGFLTSDTCTCLGLEEDPIDLSQGPLMACPQGVDSSACTGDSDICGTIIGACGLAVQVVGGSADVDLDGDGENDAISLVIGLEMEGAVISGPAAE